MTATAVRVWDIPTRLFHWLLVALFAFCWWSAENHQLEWHYISGTVLLGLFLFRMVWGVIGGSTARFATFVRSPAQVIAYLRSDPAVPRKAGHNPLGGYSVVAILLVLAVQLGTGLFAVDVDGLESGPLSYLVSFDQGREAAELHEVSFNLLLALSGIHILAILFYLVVRKRNLVRPMVTGSDPGIETAEGALKTAPLWRLIFAIVVAAGLAWWTNKGFGG